MRSHCKTCSLAADKLRWTKHSQQYRGQPERDFLVGNDSGEDFIAERFQRWHGTLSSHMRVESSFRSVLCRSQLGGRGREPSPITFPRPLHKTSTDWRTHNYVVSAFFFFWAVQIFETTRTKHMVCMRCYLFLDRCSEVQFYDSLRTISKRIVQ